MGHRLEGFDAPGIGHIPTVEIKDEVTAAEDMLIHDGSATRTYTIHASRLREISAMGSARSRVAQTLLDYIAARMEYERTRCT